MSDRKLTLLKIIVVIFLGCLSAMGQTQLPAEPTNLDFENLENNSPTGWKLSQYSKADDFSFTASDVNPANNKFSGLLQTKSNGNQQGVILQSIDAARFKTKELNIEPPFASNQKIMHRRFFG